MLLTCPGCLAYVWLREILSETAKLRLERETMTISGESRLESAAEEIGSNEDLVREILLRLPVNSLLRFKSVSKKWFSLISDPYFSHNYTLRRNPNLEPSGLLLDHDYAGLQFVPFNDDGDQARVTLSCPNEPGIMILQSCNGLLMCCSSIFAYWKEKYHIFKRYICNPTTKQFTTIRFPSPEFEASAVAVNLVFDPLKSPHYKLVCVRMVDEEETLTYQIDIYSSETGSWRPPISADPLIFTSPEDIAFKALVYCRSAIHWYSDGETSLYFDTDTECLKTMPMPPLQEGFDYHNVRYFGESRGHLHLIVINKPSALEFDILEMETDYSGWFVRYRVNLDALVITFPEVTQNHIAFSVLCVIRAEKEKESTLVLFVSGKAISFNLHDKTSKKLCDFVSCDRDDESTLDYEWSDAYQYIETLFYI